MRLVQAEAAPDLRPRWRSPGQVMPLAWLRTEWIIVSWVTHSVNLVCGFAAPTS